MDYSGAGTVHIAFNRYWIPHKVPSYVAVFPGGLDHLFSIERIQWNETTDRIVLGKGVDLLEDDAIVDPSALRAANSTAAAPHTHSAHLINDAVDAPTISSATDHALNDGERNLELVGGHPRRRQRLGQPHPRQRGRQFLLGRGGDDVLYGGLGDDTLIGGAGSDSLRLSRRRRQRHDPRRGGAGETDQLVLAGGIEPREVSLYRPSAHPDDLLLALARGGHILIKGFLASPSAGIQRVVFDHDAAWERAEIERLAHAAPLLDDQPDLPPGADGRHLAAGVRCRWRSQRSAPGHRRALSRVGRRSARHDAHAPAAPPPADPAPDACPCTRCSEHSAAHAARL